VSVTASTPRRIPSAMLEMTNDCPFAVIAPKIGTPPGDV
jgi:hypothetical protein